MKNNKILFFLIILSIFFNQTKIRADEFNFETPEIQILDKGNTIKAMKGGKVLTNDNVEIIADKFEYNKTKSSLIAKGNIKLVDEINQLIINAEEILYLKNEEKIFIKENIKLVDEINQLIINAEEILYLRNEEKILINSKMNAVVADKYFMNSKNIIYNRKKMKISSNEITKFNDNDGNKFSFEKFKYYILKKKIRGNGVTYIDNQNDLYNFKDVIIDLTSNEIAGKDVTIKFDNSKFGNKNNQPRLKANSLYSNKNSSVLKKGVFTTCKKRDKCPPWVISAEEIEHNKLKKTINYKNAWLKVYDVPVLYFPKFFHPDPTVKRQSGFLMPTLSNSNNFGLSVNIPYFHVISDNKDLTFKPRIYADQNLILQSEYRQANKNSDHIFDTSFKTSNSRSHFFSNSIINLGLSAFDTSKMEFNFQKVSNDTYLKSYNLKSPLINNTSTLSSFLSFDATREDLSVSSSFQVYENLGQPKNDRYEFIFPTFDIIKDINTGYNLGGDLSFKTSGYQKQYNTNLYEANLVNSLNFKSDPFFYKNGLKNDFSILLSNPNSLVQNSSNTTESQYRFLSAFLFETSYPLKKNNENYVDYLTPILQLRYSPNKTKNIKDDDRRIDINNIYSFDRIGSTSTVEGGQSITLGSGYKRTDKNDNKLIGLDLATVFRDETNEDLPTKSTIGNKSSDIVGNFYLKPSKFFNFEYNFSLDNSLARSNYDSIKTEFNVNNFVTTFEYLEENNLIGNESYISNKTSYNFDETNSINFSTRKNKKTDLTEFYNLIYQYQNDCLVAAVEYSKNYYEDSDLKPSENIFFSITLKPFGTTTTPSLK